jgi:hypothetical protein
MLGVRPPLDAMLPLPVTAVTGDVTRAAFGIVADVIPEPEPANVVAVNVPATVSGAEDVNTLPVVQPKSIVPCVVVPPNASDPHDTVREALTSPAVGTNAVDPARR